jgi:hypothetical protein
VAANYYRISFVGSLRRIQSAEICAHLRMVLSAVFFGLAPLRRCERYKSSLYVWSVTAVTLQNRGRILATHNPLSLLNFHFWQPPNYPYSRGRFVFDRSPGYLTSEYAYCRPVMAAKLVRDVPKMSPFVTILYEVTFWC